jgi:protein TonB
MTERRSHAFVVLLATSFVAHLAFVEAMPAADATTPTSPRPPTSITIIDTPRPPPPPPPLPIEPSTEAAPTRPASRLAHTVVRRRAPRPIAAAEPPRAVEPMALSGVTLSNEGATWSSPAGSGESGPVAVPSAPSIGRGHGGPTGERVVAVGDLSRPPKAPDLDAALAANYPQDARRAGVTGKAVVRARILADGTVGTIRVVSETGAGFGTACKRTLAGSRWQPPLDARREAVATEINYTCTFAVAR